MSFNYNPYEHIELVRDDNGYRVHCHSCGGNRPRPSESPLTDETIAEAFGIMADHVRQSHCREPSAFAGWPKY